MNALFRIGISENGVPDSPLSFFFPPLKSVWRPFILGSRYRPFWAFCVSEKLTFLWMLPDLPSAFTCLQRWDLCGPQKKYLEDRFPAWLLFLQSGLFRGLRMGLEKGRRKTSWKGWCPNEEWDGLGGVLEPCPSGEQSLHLLFVRPQMFLPGIVVWLSSLIHFSVLLHRWYLSNLLPVNLYKIVAFISFFLFVVVVCVCVCSHTLAHAVETISSKSPAQTRDVGKIWCYRLSLSAEFPLLWRRYETRFH